MLNEAFTAKGLFFLCDCVVQLEVELSNFPWETSESPINPMIYFLHPSVFVWSRDSAVIQKNGSIATDSRGLYGQRDLFSESLFDFLPQLWERALLQSGCPTKRCCLAFCGPTSPTSKCHSQFSSPLLGCKGLPCFGKTWAKCWFNVVAQLIKGRYFELQMCQLCCRHPTDVCDTGFLQVLILRYPHFVWCENGRVCILVFEIQKALDSNVNPELRYEKRGTVKTRDLTEKSFLFANRLKLERRG